MAATSPQSVVDYDSGGYDYREHWKNREYEQWAESRVLARAMERIGHPAWFADFGGGFGRNAEHYRHRADHSVIIDRSARNLEHAADRHGSDLAAGRIHLVRATVDALPFVDGAFDSAMVVRVLHHLPAVHRSLAEMGRTVRDRWLVDVPIKHHALGLLRSAARGRLWAMRAAEPVVRGTSAHPFYAFQLAEIRRWLGDADWDTELFASVNNFRRWDQALPRPVIIGLRPLVEVLELAAQRAGRGWWGPSQFLVVTRRRDVVPLVRPAPDALPATVAELARRAMCPQCHGTLRWTTERADCGTCRRSYPRRRVFWDFVAEPAPGEPGRS